MSAWQPFGQPAKLNDNQPTALQGFGVGFGTKFGSAAPSIGFSTPCASARPFGSEKQSQGSGVPPPPLWPASPAVSAFGAPINQMQGSGAPPPSWPPPPTTARVTFGASAQAADLKAFVINGVVTATSTPDAKELAERREQAALFTGAVLRDAYLFLLNPTAPGLVPASPTSATPQPQHLGAALLGKASGGATTAIDGGGIGPLDTLAFVDRAGLPTALPEGWRLLDDATTLSALDHLGEAEPMPLAATKAFELYLAKKARGWGDAQAARLSVEFLVAFGRELTPRLDVHHRLRSAALSPAEMATLSTWPFAAAVDQAVLRRYQQPLAPPPIALALPAPPALAIDGRPAALTTPMLSLTRPETPRAGLPPSPARAGEQAAPNSLVSKLFTKVVH